MKNYPQKFEPLFYYKKEGLMRTEPFMIPYKKHGFDENDTEILTKLACDESIEQLPYNKKNEGKIFAPLHAVMVLGILKAKEPFYELLKKYDTIDEEDDYFSSALMYYFRRVGIDFYDDIIDYFLDRDNNIYRRMGMLEVLEHIFEDDSKNKKFNTAFEKALVVYLSRDNELDDGLNAIAIFALVDLSGAKHIELIRMAFKTKPVDPWYDGDLEEIELRLGLIKKRKTPKPRNILGIPLDGYEDDDIFQLYTDQKKVGRNDPCPCGSGKKYKKCCIE